MYSLAAANIAANIIAVTAILRMVAFVIYSKPSYEPWSKGVVLSSRHKEFNMIPIWTLIATSILGSFILWNIYKSGGLYFGFVEMTNMSHSHQNCIVEAAVEMSQITIATLVVITFIKFSKSKVCAKFLSFLTFIFRRNKIYWTIYLINQTAALHTVKFINELNDGIVNIWHFRVLKTLRFASFMISKQQRKSFGFHALWMWVGLVVLVTVALIGRL
jgi:hypothetical protein